MGLQGDAQFGEGHSRVFDRSSNSIDSYYVDDLMMFWQTKCPQGYSDNTLRHVWWVCAQRRADRLGIKLEDTGLPLRILIKIAEVFGNPQTRPRTIPRLVSELFVQWVKTLTHATMPYVEDWE